jgi:hypothetical protein
MEDACDTEIVKHVLIIIMIKLRVFSWIGHVARMKKQNLHISFRSQIIEKKHLGRTGGKREGGTQRNRAQTFSGYDLLSTHHERSNKSHSHFKTESSCLHPPNTCNLQCNWDGLFQKLSTWMLAMHSSKWHLFEKITHFVFLLCFPPPTSATLLDGRL